MLGRTENRVSHGKHSQSKVLSGAIRKNYFQRLRHKTNRLRHGTGSVKFVDYLRIDLIEKEILRIHSFGCRLVDVLTKPFRKVLKVRQPEKPKGQSTSHARAFIQYVAHQPDGGKGSSAQFTYTTTSALSPFVTRTTSNTTGFSTSASTASWERTRIVTPERRPVHATQSAHASTEVETQELQHQQVHSTCSATSTSALKQQSISRNTPSAPNQQANVATRAVKVNVSTHTATDVQKTRCAATHCATSHWHEQSTVRNPSNSPPRWTTTSAAASSLMNSIHGPQLNTANGKRSYHDYDNEKYHGGAQYPERLKYNEFHTEETESSEYTSSSVTDTDDEDQSRFLVSYNSTQIHVETASTRFSRHDLHTFRVAARHLRNGTRVGDAEYPHDFQNRGALQLRGEPPYYTYPLLPPGDTYSGYQRPGPYRIVLDSKHVYANIITHDSSALGGFRLIC